MKILFLTFSFLFFFFIHVAPAQKPEGQRLIYDGHKLLMEHGDNTLHLDSIWQGTPVSVSITVENRSSSLLHISNARGSCGLQVPVWPRNSIEPGSTAVIQLRYDAARAGEVNRNLTLSANTHDPVTIIRIEGFTKITD